MPAHKLPLVILTDLKGATSAGRPYTIPWTVFVRGEIRDRPGEFTMIALRSLFTGEEVMAPLRNIAIFPKVVTVTEDFEFFQKFETYDTDPMREVEDGYVAVRVHGIPGAKIPARIVESASCHTHEVGHAMV